MRKLSLIVVAAILVLSLASCDEQTIIQVNAENPEGLSGTTFGKDALTEIGSGLFYDRTTGIVYWWNGVMGYNDYSTSPTPYYAPNGLPYRYDPETNTFEEIERGE